MKLLYIILILVLTACSPSLQVYTDHDPDTDIRLFSGFRWLEVENIESGQNPLYYNELNDKRIKSAVSERLRNAGYSFDRTGADLIVHYHIMVKEKEVVYTDDLGYCYSKYWVDERVHVYQYSEGTIIIDIMDANTNDLVWRGWAVGALDYDTPDDIERVINAAIGKIFFEFPHSFNLRNADQNL